MAFALCSLFGGSFLEACGYMPCERPCGEELSSPCIAECESSELGPLAQVNCQVPCCLD